MGYLFLALAIVGEVIATTFLKFTSGDKAQWWANLVVVAGYVFAFAMLAQSLARDVPLGIAYGIWAGVGVVLVAIVSWLVFQESLTWVQLVGMALVVGGVVLLEIGGSHK
ncbi:MAG TPA: multidrug efflux SMR transporter [Leifsonia sp.]|jgi:small multidrug resistance pump|nr:putative multidrug transporter EmrE [Microbacteriaceae bacterium]HEV7812617.1 multidrug efflux SMR transporter [Leifsonia sp.]